MTEMIYQIAHGRRPEPKLDYDEDRYVRFLPGDILWFLTSPDRFRQWRTFFNFGSPRVRDLVISIRDPGPTLGYLLENLGLLFDRRRRQERFRLDQARRR